MIQLTNGEVQTLPSATQEVLGNGPILEGLIIYHIIGMSVVFRMINRTHGTLKVVQQVGNSVSF